MFKQKISAEDVRGFAVERSGKHLLGGKLRVYGPPAMVRRAPRETRHHREVAFEVSQVTEQAKLSASAKKSGASELASERCVVESKRTHEIRAFELASSYGLHGWVLAQGFTTKVWPESLHVQSDRVT